jgi:hypothetical protein
MLKKFVIFQFFKGKGSRKSVNNREVKSFDKRKQDSRVEKIIIVNIRRVKK